MVVGSITFGNGGSGSGRWVTDFNGTRYVPTTVTTTGKGLEPTDRQLLEQILAELRAAKKTEEPECMFDRLAREYPDRQVWHLVCPCPKHSVRC